MATIELEAESVPDVAAFIDQLMADARRLNLDVRVLRNASKRLIITASEEALEQLFETGWRG